MSREIKEPAVAAAGGVSLEDSTIEATPINDAMQAYTEAELSLVALRSNTKQPNRTGWQTPEGAITDVAQAPNILGGIGIHHLSSRTCAIDIDHWELCLSWFDERGIDLTRLFMAEDAVQIKSGKEARGKLLFKLPEGVEWLPYVKAAEGKLELRCANGAEQSQQDVLPPSIHPDTGVAYEWVGDWQLIPTLPEELLTAWLEEAGKQAKPASKPKGKDENSPIGRFNAENSPGDILEKHQYAPSRCGTRWLYPESTTGGAGVVLLPDTEPPRVYSHHPADPLSDEHSHDAFSVFTVLDHDGDMDAALAAIGCKKGSKTGNTTDLAADSYADLSHDDLALRLGKAGGWNDRAQYVAAWNRWLFWDGSRWLPDESLRHMSWIRDFLRQVAHDHEQHEEQRAAACSSHSEAEKIMKAARNEAKLLKQSNSRVSVESTARSNPELAATVEQWDADLDLLGTPEGTVDLHTGELREAERSDYITKHVEVKPVREEPRRWLKFLHTVMQGDEEMIEFLQRLAGYMLTGHTSEHKLPFIFGPGGNGKSVFANTLHSIMADYATRAPAEAFLSTQSERHPTDLAGLQGARLVVGSELPAGRMWNESVIKDLTGGDPISARFMRQDYFTFTPQFTLLVVGNHQPKIGAVDDAMRRRLLLIPFNASISPERKDTQLEAKLVEEHGAILQWMIEGAVEWRQYGLDVPDRVTAATDDYLEAEDVLGQFIEEELIPDIQKDVQSSKVYERFQIWCEEHGIRAWSSHALTQALRERGLERKKTNKGMFFQNYKLTPRWYG